MQFIKISNKAEGVNRLYIEKLGLSTKRDNEETIGQFGSGAIFGPLAALRKGIRWITTAEDDLGPYSLEFVLVKEGEFNNIYCLYGDDEMRATSFTLEAGMLSWDDEFQIFREAFANAYDEHVLNGAEYSVDIVDEVKIEPGFISVYLSATPELLDIVNNIDMYFTINREPIHREYSGRIFNPVSGGIHIYNKGVLVYDGAQDDNYPPIYDYDFKSLTLNEERRVRYQTEIYSSVGRILSSLNANNEEELDIAARILSFHDKKKFETQTLSGDYVSSWYTSSDSAWKKAFHDKYGENAVALNQKEAISIDAVRERQYIPVLIKSDFVYSMLIAAGVKGVVSILGEKPQYDFMEVLPPRLQDNYDQSYEIVKKYDPRIENVVIKFYIPSGEQNDNVYGRYLKNENEIHISVRCLDKISMIVGTLVHELDHKVNNYSEHDAEFRNFADDRIAELLIKLYGKKVEDE
jgi:hypothetical protein